MRSSNTKFISFNLSIEQGFTAICIKHRRMKKLCISSFRQVMTATGSNISSRDNLGSNGVVHLLDDVMSPLPENSILQYCASNQNLTQLTYSFVRANLQYDIQGVI